MRLEELEIQVFHLLRKLVQMQSVAGADKFAPKIMESKDWRLELGRNNVDVGNSGG